MEGNTRVPQAGDVRTVDIPPSELFQSDPTTDEIAPNSPENLFSEAVTSENAGTAPAYARPMATSVLAIAMSNSDNSPAAQLSDENLAKARDLIDRGQDLNARIRIALDRDQRQSAVLRAMIEQGRDTLGQPFSPEVQQSVQDAYNISVQANQAERADIAAELEAVDRIRDNWTQGDDVEAYLVYQNEFNNERPFTAEEFLRDNLARQLIAGQLVEELQNKYNDSSWPRYFVNFLEGFVPFKGLFDRDGIVDDAGISSQVSGILNFFLSGDNLQLQGETLQSLPLQEYARLMAVNGPLQQAIEANSGLFIDDPGLALQSLQNLLYIDEDTQTFENVFGVLDPATAIPFGRLGKISTTLVKAGARRAAAERIADTAASMAREGIENVAARTGTQLDEVIENMEPTLINPQNRGESLATDVAANLEADRRVIAEGPQLFATTRFTTADELANAVEATKTSILNDVGEHVRDLNVVEQDVISGSTRNWLGTLPDNGNKVWTVEVTVGKKNGGGYATEATARNGVGRVAGDRADVTFFQGADSQWYGRFNVNVKEEGFVTAKLDTPEVGPFGALFNFLRSSALTTDRAASARALSGDNGFLTWQRNVSRELSRDLKRMAGDRLATTTEILKVSSTNNKWYSRAEFETLWQRGHGSLDGLDDGWRMYNRYRSYQNQIYIYRNGLTYRRMIGQGFETIEFEMGGKPFKFNGIVNESADIARGTDYFDITNRTMIRREDLSDARLEAIKNAGYVRVRLDEPLDIGNGNLVHNVIVRKDTLRRRPLERDVLGYREGPSREYTGNYWVKQTREDVSNRLLRPDVFTTGNNPNVLREWADTFNQALAAWRNGARSTVDFDAIFNGAKGFPTGQEFIDDITSGRINPKHDVEVTFDRELPRAYNERRDDVSRFMDPGESPQELLHRTTGRMFYSRRGEHVRDWTGELAETVDPWETLNKSLYNISRITSLSGYKDHILERFRRTYEKHLELRNIDRAKSLYELANARIKPGVSAGLRRQIIQEQAAINRVLNFETGFEKNLRQYRREWAQAVLGDSKDSRLRQTLHDWTLTSSPIEFMRGFAFDLKLGLFNLGQFVIQTSTSLAAISMSPRHGLFGAMMGPPMFAFRFANKRGIGDNVLDMMSKNGLWKVGGFAHELEFKAFARLSRDSGIWEVGGDTFNQITQHGPNRIYGAASTLDGVREAGRAAFYAAEQVNRNVAARIAWGEAKDAGLKIGTAEFRDFFLRRTDDYSMNMMNASAAQFQRGLLSIPTQFWAYSFRMIDSMLNFTDKTFTARQRFALIFSQFVLAGTAGVPGLDILKNWYERSTGKQFQINESTGMISRGLIDSLIYYLADTDIQASEKIGTGSLVPNLIADIFGMGTYGEKSLAEWLGGPVGSISTSIGDTLFDVVTYAMAEHGSDGNFEITQDTMLKLASEVSSLSYATKAYIAYESGIFRTKNTVAANNLPDSSAIFIAMGLQPTEVEENTFYRALNEDREQTVRDIVGQMRTWRQEAFNNPDKWEENMIKTNTLSRMIDPELRNEVLIELNRTSDNSLNEFLAKRYEDERAEHELFEALSERENNQ